METHCVFVVNSEGGERLPEGRTESMGWQNIFYILNRAVGKVEE